MSTTDPTSPTVAAIVAAADQGILTVQDVVDAFMVAQFPAFAAVIVPAVGDGAAELKQLVATYLPKIVSAVEGEAVKLGQEFLDFVGHIKRNPALVVLSNDELTVFEGVLQSPPADLGVLFTKWQWTASSILGNRAGIEMERRRRGIVG